MSEGAKGHKSQTFNQQMHVCEYVYLCNIILYLHVHTYHIRTNP